MDMVDWNNIDKIVRINECSVIESVHFSVLNYKWYLGFRIVCTVGKLYS